MSKMIYLDNAATTIMSPNTIQTMVQWMNQGNPSADYASAKKCKELLSNFRQFIAKKCGFELVETSYDDTNEKKNHKSVDELTGKEYRIIITSCASESNNTILRSVAESYKYVTGEKPHIVISAIEHKSAIECAAHLQEYDLADITFVPPNTLGFITPESISAAIQPNTCLIFVMQANNETGIINDISSIGNIAHKKGVPFYTDCSQSFGKFLINPIKNNIDAFCVSFHKMQGPPGIGLLIIKEKFIRGYKLCPLICGTQNGGLRGGTENIALVAASFIALKSSLLDREDKNRKMLENKKYIMKELSKYVPAKTYREYLETKNHKKQNSTEVIFLSTGERLYLPNILLLSVVKRDPPKICNGELKKKLESKGIIVSIGSACNTTSPKASHVLYAMNVDPLIRTGVLRISINENTTKEECEKFVQEFINILREEINPSD